ncbi:LysR family transcriptional regulator [Acetobacter suratthaniensis]|mgnify:FL=1|uniref:LysR family transcriptional regulator n=1 Tax=Acetobacter suratthaniensis TaxID=1502841 RepID=A0ABS3LNE7_9PROT|nr:LysR family transcriptional regulator [Acetobacter suratthaniensis]MBO1328894.1 LysR family transcriptional regulator [Acetobacter suratthaniensis]MCX2567043.1 LysR family transcriptional regulator [Acetobacter suratthaniensis]
MSDNPEQRSPSSGPARRHKTPPAEPGFPPKRVVSGATRVRRLDNIDLRLLRVFAVLAETGSFAAAQIALNLSQSTLSTHLASLEQRLGGALCLRGRKGFRLTAFGQETLDAIQDLFESIELFQARVSQAPQELGGRLRIGSIGGIINNPDIALQDVLARVIDQVSTVHVDLQLGIPQDLELQVADGTRDVAIGPFARHAPGVRYLPLCEEPHALYCGQGHPFFDMADERITKDMIDRARFSVRAYRKLEDLQRINHPRASGSIVHMEAQLMMILSGRFIGFLPEQSAAPYRREGRLRPIQPSVYYFVSQHYIAFRAIDQSRNVLQIFIRELLRQAGRSEALNDENAR